MLLIRNVLLPDFASLTTAPADVLIDGGRFADIAPRLSADCASVDGRGRLMLPGMADLHTHMVQSLTKGPLDDLNITQWLKKMLAVQWSLTDEEWYWGVLLGCLESLRCGVTAINEMTYFPHIDAVVQAYQDAGIRATFGVGATDIAENEVTKVTSVDDCLRQAELLYDRWHGKGLLRTAAVPQGRPACTPELMQALKRFARERGLLYHTHLAEGRAETALVRQWTGRGEAEELAYLGVLDEQTILAHAIWLSDSELSLLAQSRAVVAHCPSTNMKLSDGVPQAPTATCCARRATGAICKRCRRLTPRRSRPTAAGTCSRAAAWRRWATAISAASRSAARRISRLCARTASSRPTAAAF